MMNDEIKEILIFIENKIYPKDSLLFEKWSFLKDYITNLQEKLEVAQDNEESYRLEMQDITKALALDEHTLFDDVKDYATNLQQENQELNDSITWWNNRFNAVQRDYEDYKSRKEKAVEYIKKYRAMYFPSGCGDAIKYVPLEFKRDYYENGSTFTETENLLDILNGRSDE